jgi:anti-sigma factor RsiW
MTDDERLALIHAEIDGELADDRRGDLARLLLAEPQTRALREQLQRVDERLDRVAAVEPPPDLKDAILRRLPPANKLAVTGRGWSASRWRQAALIAGLVTASAVVYQTVRGPGAGSGETAGTMAAGTAAALDSVVLDTGPVTGRVRLYREGTGLAVALEVTAAQPVDVLIISAGHSFRISGLGSGHADAATHQTVALPGVGMRGQDIELTFLLGERAVRRATLRAPVER